jgi:ABC-type lipoprotein release transport system permease subunit
MKRRRMVIRERSRAAGGVHPAGKVRGRVARLFLWESLVLGIFGAVASVVVGAMVAGVLNSTNVQVPLSMQLFLMSDSFELSVLPSALGGAIALIALVTGAHALALRAFRLRT